MLASRFGPTGAALSMLVSEALLCGACLAALKRDRFVTPSTLPSNPVRREL
jgi:hypothetical protein